MEENNKLTVTAENGQDVTINVLDIIDSEEFDKTFMIYNIDGNDEAVFASILNEKDDSFSLDTIVEPNELNYINHEIDRVVNEQEGD